MTPKWMEIVKAEIGQHESPGAKQNPRIVEYHSVTTLKATSDEVPWCASFVCWVMEQAGIRSTKSAAAKSWATWGEPCEPKPGCVIVIQQKRGGADKATGSASGYHVGFLVEDAPGHVVILGGNQADSVRRSTFSKDRYAVVATRWPA